MKPPSSPPNLFAPPAPLRTRRTRRVGRPADLPQANLVLLYDCFTTALRGKAFCEQLIEQLEVRGNLDEALWRSDLLAVPEIRQEAAVAALGADFVVLSLRGDADLPEAVERWCESWMPLARGRDLTLVVLFDPATAVRAEMENIRGYLRRAAFAAGIHFFGHAWVTASSPFLGAADVPIETPAVSVLPEPNLLLEHTSTILVADDYPSVCQVVAKVLNDAGHRTLTARDGVEAQHIVENNAPIIDLVITDIEMPRMRGDDLSRWLLREYPAMPILLMSSTLPDGEEIRRLPLLAKPFTTKALVAAVENLLHHAAAA